MADMTEEDMALAHKWATHQCSRCLAMTNEFSKLVKGLVQPLDPCLHSEAKAGGHRWESKSKESKFLNLLNF